MKFKYSKHYCTIIGQTLLGIKNDLVTALFVGGVLGTIIYFCKKRPYLFLMDPLVKKKFLNLITYQPCTPNHILVDHLATAKNDDVFETRILVKKKKCYFQPLNYPPGKKNEVSETSLRI